MPRVTRDAPEARRDELVLAAYREIAENGFEGLRTREVAGAVGVNVATLHYYFPSKEDLIKAVVGHAMSRFQSTLAAEGSAIARLRGLLRGARADGDLPKTIDPDGMTAVIVATLKGVYLLPGRSTGSESIEKALRQLEDLLGLRGKASKPR